jgi:hypothetical protein
MFGVLIVVLGRDRIAGTLRVARQLEIFLGNVGGRSPDFHVRSVGLVHARQWILVMMTTFAVATPHALILTVSHDLLFRQPPSFAATLWPPFLLTELPSYRTSLKRTARWSMARCIRYRRRRSPQ